MQSVSSSSATPPSAHLTPGARLRGWFQAAAALGLLWNAYGVYQFAASLGATPDTLMAGGLNGAQADLYLSLPAWMSIAFAVGAFGGLVGSLALAARRYAAPVVFAVSLIGYTMLFAGDAWFGLFAAIPGQLAIMSVVMLIAVGLLATSLQARRRGWLQR